MVVVQDSLCCHSNSKDEEDQQHSESSFLSSQPSLPSVPSLALTPQQPQTTHHKLLATVKSHTAHTAPISSLALHAKSLFSASSNGQIQACTRHPFTLQTSTVRDPTSINNIPNINFVVQTSNAPIKHLIFSHDDTMFTAHQDHKIRVWKTDHTNANYKCVATLPTFQDRFSKLFSSNNYVEIRRHKKTTWVHHVDAVSALALSQDSSLLYSASWDTTFKIWRTSDFRCLESVKNAHDDAINSLVLSSDNVVYTGSADTKIKMWKKRDGEKKHSLISTLEKHKSAVNALALSGDGSVLYSGACDRSILVWENDENKNMVVVGALRGHTKAILCLVVVDDLVCSGSADNSVRIWRRGVEEKGYSCLAVLEGHTRPVKCLAMAVDSNSGGPHDESSKSYLLYTAGLDCHIKVWQIRLPLQGL
ncbi:hypothetical protein VNO78_09078 [Psophocarpus tetragonolobus]|uniref:Uncharacterized protein n=1 Tax=Psophocarpus tetragonolobus TaxID=3891 RepID=A0AAN9XT12_PSOTE